MASGRAAKGPALAMRKAHIVKPCSGEEIAGTDGSCYLG
jgi:hypothetical protein